MGFDDDIEQLRQVPLLSALDEEGLRFVAFNGERVSVQTGETLFIEGDYSPGALFVLNGRIALYKGIGETAKEYAVAERGSIIDCYALISEKRRSGSAEAISPADYLILDRKTFRKVLEMYPDLAKRVRDEVVQDVSDSVTSFNAVADRLSRLD